MGFFKKHFLLFTVFVTGASVLIIEVVAVRILAPYFGSTIFTVSSVISVILLALSFGYYAGGKLSDKYPSQSVFFGIILLSGVTILLLHILGTIALPILSASFSISSGPLISSLFLFLIPALLLGTLSPYAIKLQSLLYPNQGVGSVAGEIFFWSTFGSIVGSLLTGFFLIPRFGIDKIVISTGLVLFTLGFTPLLFLGKHKKYLRFIPFVLILLFLTVSLPKHQKNEKIVYIKDGVYEKLIIYEDIVRGRSVRFFQQDHSNSGAMFLDTNDPTDLVFDYSKYYALYKVFTSKVQNALVIGGGAYSIPRALTAELPNATIDVSEIEPSLFKLSKEYFRVSNTPNIKNYIEDGRRFLQRSDKKYDLIFSDVYYSFYSIPMHFTTQEFFELAKEKLNNEGIFIANLTGDLSANPPSLIMSEIKTFQSVFQNSYFFAVESPELKTAQNIMFIGYKSDKKIDFNSQAITEHTNKTINSLKDRIIDTTQLDLDNHQVLTDNYSPVEYLTGQVLK